MPFILLIDANAEYRQMLAKQLVREGFDTYAVSTGQEGLNVASQKKIDLVLLDMHLPKTDGVDTFHTLRTTSTTQNLPMMLLTDLAPTDYWRRLKYNTDGATYVTNKSDDSIFLLARINELIGSTYSAL